MESKQGGGEEEEEKREKEFGKLKRRRGRWE
jgi:hypothetical protein